MKRVWVLLLIFCLGVVNATTYYVSNSGSDSNLGISESSAFATVGKAIDSAKNDEDVVHIKAGNYNMNGYSATIGNKLTIEGENNKNTILIGGGSIIFNNSLTVKNISFKNYSNIVFIPISGDKNELNGVYFKNCIFENVPGAINGGSSLGVIKNIYVLDSVFKNIYRNGETFGVSLLTGKISNIYIINNSFDKVYTLHTERGASAIWIGSNAVMETTKDVFIENNYITQIAGPAGTDQQNREAHGVIAYGSNINIERNTIKNVSYSKDHEAIYTKVKDSRVVNNIVVNGGGVDIMIKGGEFSDNNVIEGNRITGNQSGSSLTVYGGAIIRFNYINKPNGYGGTTYPMGKTYVISDNYFESKGRCFAFNSHPQNGSTPEWDPKNSKVFNNTFISYDGPIYIKNSQTGVEIYNNFECLGFSCNPPEFFELCYNGFDDDFDGYYDCADDDCECDVNPPILENCNNSIDDDSDGLIDCLDSNCPACISQVDVSDIFTKISEWKAGQISLDDVFVVIRAWGNS